MTYSQMAKRAERADPDTAARLASILLRIYEADRTDNCGVVNGEAVLCEAFRKEAYQALFNAGVFGNV